MTGNMGAAQRPSDYQIELSRLLDDLLLMGARVEQQLAYAVTAYEHVDVVAAQQAVSGDRNVDLLERKIDGECFQLLARRKPVSSDLRFVTATLKVVTDLERIGDLCTSIGQRVLESAACGVTRHPRPVVDMGALASDLVQQAIDAFVARSTHQAAHVVEREAEIDRRYAALWPAVAKEIAQQPDSAGHLMRVLAMAKSIERIADHATSIAQMVVFMVDGHDVRHLEPAEAARNEAS